jgi:hypothetical protein
MLYYAVTVLNLYLFATQYLSIVIFDKQDVDTLLRTFIPRSDVNKSITGCEQPSPQQWRNTEGVMSAICEAHGDFRKWVDLLICIYTTANGDNDALWPFLSIAQSMSD